MTRLDIEIYTLVILLQTFYNFLRQRYNPGSVGCVYPQALTELNKKHLFTVGRVYSRPTVFFLFPRAISVRSYFTYSTEAFCAALSVFLIFSGYAPQSHCRKSFGHGVNSSILMWMQGFIFRRWKRINPVQAVSATILSDYCDGLEQGRGHLRSLSK